MHFILRISDTYGDTEFSKLLVLRRFVIKMIFVRRRCIYYIEDLIAELKPIFKHAIHHALWKQCY